MTNTRRSKSIINSLEAHELQKRSTSQKIADRLTRWFGSKDFLFANIIFFSIWIVINTGLFPFIPVFDPYPFFQLTTMVSLEAIILTTIVLMSQNRQSHVSTLREEMQLQVELYQEREVTKIIKLLSLLMEKNGIKVEDKDIEEMLKELDTSYIERKLTDQLDGKNLEAPIEKDKSD